MFNKTANPCYQNAVNYLCTFLPTKVYTYYLPSIGSTSRVLIPPLCILSTSLSLFNSKLRTLPTKKKGRGMNNRNRIIKRYYVALKSWNLVSRFFNAFNSSLPFFFAKLHNYRDRNKSCEIGRKNYFVVWKAIKKYIRKTGSKKKQNCFCGQRIKQNLECNLKTPRNSVIKKAVITTNIGYFEASPCSILSGFILLGTTDT